MSLKIKFILVVILMIAARTSVNAQRIALATNLIEDVVILTPNIGVDLVLSDRQSISFDTSIAPYKISDTFYNKCMTFRAGYKYWFSQAFYAHYIGVDAIASSSDVLIRNTTFRDEYIGLGLGYGYSFIISKRLNLVPHVGVGLAYGKSYDGYDHMGDSGIGVQAQATTGIKPVITRLGVTIQYVLR